MTLVFFFFINCLIFIFITYLINFLVYLYIIFFHFTLIFLRLSRHCFDCIICIYYIYFSYLLIVFYVYIWTTSCLKYNFIYLIYLDTINQNRAIYWIRPAMIVIARIRRYINGDTRILKRSDFVDDNWFQLNYMVMSLVCALHT